MKVSIVIPAFNEEKYIKNCLESLVSQKTRHKFEVIVVDNNSEDKTIQIVQKFKDRLDLKIVQEKKQGRGAARAKGFKEACGEIILSTDADTILPTDWIEALAKPIIAGTLATTTACKINDGSKYKNTIFNLFQPQSMFFYRFLFGHFWLSGFSFGILKSAYEKSGGFNQNLQAQEDIDLSWKVTKLGKIKFINKPVTFSGRRFRKGLIQGLYEYTKALIQLILKREIYLSNIR